jgi:hypothetical protein
MMPNTFVTHDWLKRAGVLYVLSAAVESPRGLAELYRRVNDAPMDVIDGIYRELGALLDEDEDDGCR